MHFSSDPFPRFNLASMSGVYAGTRTDIYYRLRLWRLEEANPHLRWHQLLLPAPPAQPMLLPYRPEVTDPAPEKQTHAPRSLPAGLNNLAASLKALGEGLHACGTCRHWQHVPQPDHSSDIQQEPRLPARGRCTWTTSPHHTPHFPELAEQTALALGCIHWEPYSQPENLQPENDTRHATPQPDIYAKQEPAPAQQSWPRRLLDRLLFRPTSHHLSAPSPTLAERSGVGAGTEPCFACHGRLANLGALVVESLEGDPLTYSIWRCRVCQSSFLNRWADRWVRLDNLETDEAFYRIAPDEADAMLTIIRTTPGADHPKGRQERATQRAQLEELALASDRISHQIKQGR